MYVCDYERILSFYHSIGSPIDGAHQVRRPIEIIWAVTVRRPLKRQRERKKVVPPGIEYFLSFPLPFQRSTDINGPDYLYRSLDLVSPIYRAPNAVIKAQDSFVIRRFPCTETWKPLHPFYTPTYHSFTAYIIGDIIGDIRIHIQICTCSLLYQLLLGISVCMRFFLSLCCSPWASNRCVS